MTSVWWGQVTSFTATITVTTITYHVDTHDTPKTASSSVLVRIDSSLQLPAVALVMSPRFTPHVDMYASIKIAGSNDADVVASAWHWYGCSGSILENKCNANMNTKYRITNTSTKINANGKAYAVS